VLQNKDGRSLTDRLRPRSRQHRLDWGSERDELVRQWGVAVCARCGRTILLREKTALAPSGNDWAEVREARVAHADRAAPARSLRPRCQVS
jgi:hypothetical protein